MFPYFLKMCLGVLVPHFDGDDVSHISFKINNVKKGNSNDTLKKYIFPVNVGLFQK